MSTIDKYNNLREKFQKVSKLRSEINGHMKTSLNELETMMKFYDLGELIKGETKFVLDKKWKRKAVKPTDYAKIVAKNCDPLIAQRINSDIETMRQQSSEEVRYVKCLKHRESTK
jgi:hypothetical protein